MANPLEGDVKIVSPGPRQAWKGPLGGLGWSAAWADYCLYTVEYVLVVVALVTMTVVEFVYLLSLFAVNQKIEIGKVADGGALPWALPGIAFFLWLMAFAATRGRGEAARPLPLRLGLATGILAGVIGVGALSLWLGGDKSSWFYVIVVVGLLGPIAFSLFKKGKNQAAIGVGVGMVVGVVASFTLVPDGFSWADKRALFMLLWASFFGASMAAKQGRHLKIDLARKICPPRFLKHLNVLSYAFAAAFTGSLVFISGIYMFHEDYGRFWTRSTPGEIPDWLLVCAIPVAFAIITLRFAARSLNSALSEPKTDATASTEEAAA
jgi:C4-dicarboxylate transporter, DctQ subunit